MDPRLLRYYNQELRYLREMGGQFAREFPKIAGRLGMEGMEVADPYVERLIEGCAFLAARVQLKQDAEFPNLAQRLLDMVSPNLGAPVPSMTVPFISTRIDGKRMGLTTAGSRRVMPGHADHGRSELVSLSVRSRGGDSPRLTQASGSNSESRTGGRYDAPVDMSSRFFSDNPIREPTN